MKKVIETDCGYDDKGYRRVWLYDEIDGFEFKTFCGLVDKSGTEVVSCKYHNILGFYHNNPLACVELNDKWGYIDEDGKEVVPCQYDFAEDMFYCGLATVEKDEKWGCIDSTGKLIIPLVYDDSIIFFEQLAGAKRNGKYGVISTNGNIVIDFCYDYCGVMGQNRICVEQYGKCGLIDYKGNIIVPCIYDGISNILTGNRVSYKKGNEHGFMDLNGKVIQILYAS